MEITVNHVEIPVLDLKKAKEFYKTIFEWNIDLESIDNYGICEIKNSASIGFYLVDKIPEHGINVVFEVEDIEKKLREIEKAGGEITREKYEIAPEIGFSAQFKDCFGNELGLYSRS